MTMLSDLFARDFLDMPKTSTMKQNQLFSYFQMLATILLRKLTGS